MGLFHVIFCIPLSVFFLSFFVCISAFAQDTAHPTGPLTLSISENELNHGRWSAVDTSLETYHYYAPGFYRLLKNTGNIGSPVQSLYYHAPDNTGFNSGIAFMDVYASKKEEVEYFHSRRPYSKIFFLTGSKEEQILNIRHTQNIGRPFNFGLNYTNLSSLGFYQRQKVRGNNFLAHAGYEAKNRLYGNVSNFIYHRTVVEENGGLYNDGFFEAKTDERKDAMRVKLQGASNFYKKKSWYFKQYLNFGKRETVFDAADSINRRLVVPFVRLSHTFSFEKQIYYYRDGLPDSAYYLPLFTYVDSLNPSDTLKDSLNVKIFENTFSLSTINFENMDGRHHGFRNFYASVFLKHQNIDRLTHNAMFDTTLHNLVAGAEMNVRFLRLFSVGGKATEVLQGFNKADHNYRGYLEFRPDSSAHQLRLSTFHQVKHPDWIQTHYFSDQLQWRYDFFNSSYSGQTISYRNDKWRIQLGASQNFVKNPVFFSRGEIFTDSVYMGNRIIPRQRNGRFTINQAYFTAHLRLWKFNLKPSVYVQRTSHNIILPFPGFTTHNSFYFESKMLRKAVFAQIGVDFYYFTSYLANDYSPFLKQFYVQDEKWVGDYPFFDFFVNFKIKNVRAFFKLTHLNSGFSGNTYYMIPHYPQPDRAFHLGIDWRFLD